MAIVLRQSKTASSNTDYVNGINLVTTSAVAAGSTLILMAASSAATVDGVVITDDQGNTWNKIYSKASGTRAGELWYATNCNPGITTIYVSDPANYNQRAVVVNEYSGVATTGTIDVSNFVIEVGYTDTHSISITNTTQPAILIGGFIASAGDAVYTATGASGNKIQANAASTAAVSIDNPLTTIGTQTLSLTTSGTAYEEGIMFAAVLKETAVAPPTFKRWTPTLLGMI